MNHSAGMPDSTAAAAPGARAPSPELGALYRVLPAQSGELERLLEPLRQARLAPPQIGGLLKQAWQRLQELRALETELCARAAHDRAQQPLKQAFDGLRAGAAFSPDTARTALETAARRADAPGLNAEILAARALLATISLDYRHAASRYAEAATAPDLDSAQRWRYRLRQAQALQEMGREFGDQTALEQAVELYQTAVLALAPRAERPEDWAATQHGLGDALGTLGQYQPGTRLLEKAVAALNDALAGYDRERAALAWAAVQNSLGNALGALAQRQGDSDMLEKSVAAFAAALEVRTQEQTAHDWAVSQNNLGAALLVLGQRNKDRHALKRATDAYRKALRVWTRQQTPFDWASALNNLGTALRLLGDYRRGPRTLEQAVAACRSALAGRPRERVPGDWAMTQNNLGAALQRLGEREQDAAPLAASIEAYGSALEEWTRERSPGSWAMTRANQGAARKALAELTGDIDLVHAALADFAAVGEVFRGASHAQYYELAVEQIARLRELEQKLTGDRPS